MPGATFLRFLGSISRTLSDTPIIFNVQTKDELRSWFDRTSPEWPEDVGYPLDIALAPILYSKGCMWHAIVRWTLACWKSRARVRVGNNWSSHICGLSVEDCENNCRLRIRSCFLFVCPNRTARLGYSSARYFLLWRRVNSSHYANRKLIWRGIGGRLLFRSDRQSRAKMGGRILGGESPQNIALQTVPSTTMFDWRELRRWGIDENKLPVGSAVRFKEPTFWEQYKWRVVGVASLIILQALLIIWLLINRAKRRQAEALYRQRATYRNVFETQPHIFVFSGSTDLC